MSILHTQQVNILEALKKSPLHFEMSIWIYCLVTFPLLLTFLLRLENRTFTVRHSHSPRRDVLYDTMLYFSPTPSPFPLSRCSCQLTEGERSPMFHVLTREQVPPSELRNALSKATLSSSILINTYLPSPKDPGWCSWLILSACHCTHNRYFLSSQGKTKIKYKGART